MSLNINLEENLILAQNNKNFEQGPRSQNGLSAPKHHLNDHDDIFTRTQKISENQPLDKKSSNESLDSLQSQEKNYSAHSQTSKSNQEIKFEPSPTAEQDFLEKDEVQTKQNDTLFYQIGGLSMIERVVNIMYEDKVKEFQLTNISSCSQKRIQLLKKQQISFLTDLLDGPQNDESGALQIACKRSNQENFNFYLRVLKKAFKQCKIEDVLIDKVNDLINQKQQQQNQFVE